MSQRAEFSADKSGVSAKSNLGYDDDFDDVDGVSGKSALLSKPTKHENHGTKDTSIEGTGGHSALSEAMENHSSSEAATIEGALPQKDKPKSRGRERLQSAGDDNAYGDDDFEEFIE